MEETGRNVTGKNVTEKNGYLYLSGAFAAGEAVDITFEFHPVLLTADSRVSEDEGMAALQCGPLVYCLEQADNGAALSMCRVTEETTFTESWMQMDGVLLKALHGNGLRRQPAAQTGLYCRLQKAQYYPVTLTWIPYFAWANRGEGEMQVWTRVR